MRNGLVGFALGGVLLVVAACSGGGGATGPTAAPASAATTESGAPAGGGAGTDNQPSAEASVAAQASAPPAGGGGGTAAGVCELVSADELAGIFGVTVTMTVLTGPPDTCIVDTENGDPLTAWSLTTAQSSVIYEALTTDPSTIPVAGVGDKAAIVQNTGLLVLKGSNLVTVMIPGAADLSEEEGVEASKQIGALAAGRL